VISGRKGYCEKSKEEDLMCECDERLEEEGYGDEGRSEEWRATVSILLNEVATLASWIPRAGPYGLNSRRSKPL
jgi:hypothetical protein